MLSERQLKKEAIYVVGVSGGCDSMALLDMLVSRHYQVHVAHVNYNLRNDTHEDYRVVHDYCEAHGLPFHYRVFHKEDYQSGNFQEQARKMRYGFYHEIYERYHCQGVLLGHHLNDQLETIYMHLERGSITPYLGIREVTMIQNMTIIRPLLSCYKKELRSYCEDNGIRYHDDYTNFQTEFTRDRVRNTVLNTYTQAQLQDLLDQAQKHNREMEKQEQAIQPYLVRYHERGMLCYSDIPEELRRPLFFAMLEEHIPSQSLSASLLEEIIHQFSSDKPNIEMNLPVNYVFIKAYDNIYILDHDDLEEYTYTFDVWEPFTCAAFSLSTKGPMNYGVPLTQDDFPITIRSFQIGDKIMTTAGTKKVSRLFINAKIPARKRKRWPILLNKEGTILLIPGIAKNIDYLTTNPNCFVLE